MAYPIIFGTACIGLVVTTIVWCALLFKSHRGHRHLLIGPAGTLCASIPILAAWMPETFQPLWIVIQLTFLFWLMSFVLIGLSLNFAFVLKTSRRERIVAVVCGGAGLLLNATAFLTFMWYATTSPGGV